MRADDDDDGMDGEEGHTPPSLASSRIFGPNPQLGKREVAFTSLPFPLSLSFVPFPLALPHSLATHACAHTHDARHHGRLIPAFFAFFSPLGLRRTDGRAEKRLRERIARPEMNSLLLLLRCPTRGRGRGSCFWCGPSESVTGCFLSLVKRLFRQNCLFKI